MASVSAWSVSFGVGMSSDAILSICMSTPVLGGTLQSRVSSVGFEANVWIGPCEHTETMVRGND